MENGIQTVDKETSLDDVLRLIGALEWSPCGSRVTCAPPPMNTDADYLVVLPNDDAEISAAVGILADAGFEWEGSEHYQMELNTFMSFRREDVNLIVTRSAGFAERHKLATAVCKSLNLLEKKDRIVIFQAILYQAPPNPSP